MARRYIRDSLLSFSSCCCFVFVSLLHVERVCCHPATPFGFPPLLISPFPCGRRRRRFFRRAHTQRCEKGTGSTHQRLLYVGTWQLETIGASNSPLWHCVYTRASTLVECRRRRRRPATRSHFIGPRRSAFIVYTLRRYNLWASLSH